MIRLIYRLTRSTARASLAMFWLLLVVAALWLVFTFSVLIWG